jgi:protein-disulfide isomerase
LDELKKENPEFATFIVDYASDEPIVRIIKKAYNITDVPSFVVGEQVYTGYHDLTQLKEILAEHI